jgi:hypothetical protein
MSEWITNFWLRLFIWSGGKLFGFASVYMPDGENGNVLAIHFARDEVSFMNSCRAILHTNDDSEGRATSAQQESSGENGT